MSVPRVTHPLRSGPISPDDGIKVATGISDDWEVMPNPPAPPRLWLWRIDGEEVGESAGSQTVYAVTTSPAEPPDPQLAIRTASGGSYEFYEVSSITLVCQLPVFARVGSDEPPTAWAEAMADAVRSATKRSPAQGDDR